MELQLGLALPTHNIEGLDLNNPALVKLWRPSCGNSESKKHVKNKRTFEESFLKPLPLLVWSGQPNEEDDGSEKNMQRNFHTSNKNNEDENNLVGWPPIKSFRKKELHQQQDAGGQIRNDRMQVNEIQSRRSNPLYVKVNMEGVAIGRKINLRLYNSYHTLTNTLLNMFARYQNFEDKRGSYTLTFQNEQGDWLLTRQVPWQSFIGTVRRLVILREK